MKDCEFYEFDGICAKHAPHEFLCTNLNGCAFKLLLAEQAKTKKLVEALEKIWTNTTFGTLNNIYLQSENLTYTELDNLLRPYIQSLHECASVYNEALNEVNK